jgi:hypothetical protein
MSWNESRTKTVTPKKKPSHRSRCSRCHCLEFQSDDAVTAAVESDAIAEALIVWLSGGVSATSGDGENASVKTERCPNRLSASILILNSIRDACRPHLESSTPAASPAISCLSDSVKNDQDAEPNFSDKATYEDSFPSLSSMSVTEPLTLLVGRKKGKGAKPGNDSTKPSWAGPSCNKQSLNTGANPDKSRMGTVNHEKIRNNHHPTVRAETAVLKAKKGIKPVTLSRSTESWSSESGKSCVSLSNGAGSKWTKGSISSLPSQDASEILETKSDTAFVNTTRSASTDAALKVVSDSADVNIGRISTTINSFNAQKTRRLVVIYSTILRSQLAPSLLMELHLLVRLLSLHDKRPNPKSTTVNGIGPLCEIFQSDQSCREFAAEALTALESILVNMGHSTVKMFVELPTLQRSCPGLCMTLQDVLDTGDSTLIFESDQKALGHNTNVPHLTLPFDHARDSRHSYRSVDLNRLFKEREDLRDAFLYQLRAFQDVRGRLMEHEQVEKNIDSLRFASREMLTNVSPGNTIWFANLFCDLLVQVGLIPISETDSEVLKIGDKKRLQVSCIHSTSIKMTLKTLLSLANTRILSSCSYLRHRNFT